eukprot:1836187-Ditylum_brightwellii.AAC.1
MTPGNQIPPVYKRHQHDPEGYYWSHRYCVVMGCNSRTCSNMREGHQYVASRANHMGGSEVSKN